MLYFLIIGPNDVPLLEIDVHSLSGQSEARTDPVQDLAAHASLDVIEAKMAKTTSLYLKDVDTFHEFTISAYVTPGRMFFCVFSTVFQLFFRHAISFNSQTAARFCNSKLFF